MNDFDCSYLLFDDSVHKKINKYQHELKFEYFEKAILDVKKSVTNSDLKEFEKWATEKN